MTRIPRLSTYSSWPGCLLCLFLLPELVLSFCWPPWVARKRIVSTRMRAPPRTTPRLLGMTIPDFGMALLGLVSHPQILPNFVIFSPAFSYYFPLYVTPCWCSFWPFLMSWSTFSIYFLLHLIQKWVSISFALSRMSYVMFFLAALTSSPEKCLNPVRFSAMGNSCIPKSILR